MSVSIAPPAEISRMPRDIIASGDTSGNVIIQEASSNTQRFLHFPNGSPVIDIATATLQEGRHAAERQHVVVAQTASDTHIYDIDTGRLISSIPVEVHDQQPLAATRIAVGTVAGRTVLARTTHAPHGMYRWRSGVELFDLADRTPVGRTLSAHGAVPKDLAIHSGPTGPETLILSTEEGLHTWHLPEALSAGGLLTGYFRRRARNHFPGRMADATRSNATGLMATGPYSLLTAHPDRIHDWRMMGGAELERRRSPTTIETGVVASALAIGDYKDHLGNTREIGVLAEVGSTETIQPAALWEHNSAHGPNPHALAHHSTSRRSTVRRIAVAGYPAESLAPLRFSSAALTVNALAFGGVRGHGTTRHPSLLMGASDGTIRMWPLDVWPASHTVLPLDDMPRLRTQHDSPITAMASLTLRP